MVRDICLYCNKEKPIEDLVKNKRKKNGYERECKQCHTTRQKKWARENKDTVKEMRSKQYRNNLKPTVYCIVSNGKTIYIGSTNNMQARVSIHKSNAGRGYSLDGDRKKQVSLYGYLNKNTFSFKVIKEFDNMEDARKYEQELILSTSGLLNVNTSTNDRIGMEG